MKQLTTRKAFAEHILKEYPDSNPRDILNGIRYFNEFVYPYRDVDFEKSEMFIYLKNVELEITKLNLKNDEQ